MSAMSFPPNQFAALNGALLTTAGKQSFRPKIVQILNDKAAGSISIKVFQLLEAAYFAWVDPGWASNLLEQEALTRVAP